MLGQSIDEVKASYPTGLLKWTHYTLAVSLPPNLLPYPENSLRSRIVENYVIPVCRGIIFLLPY